MKSIGGFLDLEVSREIIAEYHSRPALSTGRSCIFFLVQLLRPSCVHVPYYVCDAVVQALEAAGVRHRFYDLDVALEIRQPPELSGEDLLIYVNYFGIKGGYALDLARKYGPQLLVDDSQAFFQTGYPNAWAFNSARKFFGVPDGAYLYGPASVPNFPAAQRGYDHLVERFVGNNTKSHQLFRTHEAKLDHSLRSISPLSLELLKRIDYSAVAAIRRRNFAELHHALATLNHLSLDLATGMVPLYYPLLLDIPLRPQLIQRGVFVPQLWPEVITRSVCRFRLERNLAQLLLPLPIDQRYGIPEMTRVITEVKTTLKCSGSSEQAGFLPEP